MSVVIGFFVALIMLVLTNTGLFGRVLWVALLLVLFLGPLTFFGYFFLR